ncbi:ATP-dependent DNA helicase PIF1 [Sarotherodon galilaeus]
MALRARSCVSFGESSVQLRWWPAATWSGLIEQWRLQESHTLLFYGRASLIGAASTLKLLACNFSCLASLYLAMHDVRGGKGAGGMSCPQINGGHQYQRKPSAEAGRAAVAARRGRCR